MGLEYFKKQKAGPLGAADSTASMNNATGCSTALRPPPRDWDALFFFDRRKAHFDFAQPYNGTQKGVVNAAAGGGSGSDGGDNSGGDGGGGGWSCCWCAGA